MTSLLNVFGLWIVFQFPGEIQLLALNGKHRPAWICDEEICLLVQQSLTSNGQACAAEQELR